MSDPYRTINEIDDYPTIRLETAGSVEGHRTGDHGWHLDPRIFQCGKIENGVALHAPKQAGFVIEFADFERAYLAAKKFRDEGAETCDREGHPGWGGSVCGRCGREA